MSGKDWRRAAQSVLQGRVPHKMAVFDQGVMPGKKLMLLQKGRGD